MSTYSTWTCLQVKARSQHDMSFRPVGWFHFSIVTAHKFFVLPHNARLFFVLFGRFVFVTERAVATLTSRKECGASKSHTSEASLCSSAKSKAIWFDMIWWFVLRFKWKYPQHNLRRFTVPKSEAFVACHQGSWPHMWRSSPSTRMEPWAPHSNQLRCKLRTCSLRFVSFEYDSIYNLFWM